MEPCEISFVSQNESRCVEFSSEIDLFLESSIDGYGSPNYHLRFYVHGYFRKGYQMWNSQILLFLYLVFDFEMILL